MSVDSSDEPKDERGPAIIVQGSVISGFKFIGPFDTIDQAVEWYRFRSMIGMIGIPIQIVLLSDKSKEAQCGDEDAEENKRKWQLTVAKETINVPDNS